MPRYYGNALDGDFTYVDVSWTQNYGTNTSTVYWSLYFAVRPPYYAEVRNAAFIAGGVTRWSNGGTVLGNSSSNQNKDHLLASGNFAVGHDANGYASFTVAGYAHPYVNNSFGTASTASGTVTLDRIPKPPEANGAPVVSNLLPTSATFSWPANTNNNGASIDLYKLRVRAGTPADGAGFVDHDVSAGTLSKAVTGLTPGTQYYAVVYARNSQGYSPKSGEVSFRTPSGMYPFDGSTFRPSEVIVRNPTNTGWLSGEVLYRNASNTAWESAS